MLTEARNCMERRLLRFAAGLGLLALAGFAGAACGVDDPGTDGDFVLELCDATKALEADFATAVSAASEQTDPAKAVEALAPPLDTFVAAFEDAKPPEDLEEWHKTAAKQLRASVDKFKAEKTLASLEGFGDSPVPDPPAEAKQRLREAAEDVDGCEGVAFLKP